MGVAAIYSVNDPTQARLYRRKKKKGIVPKWTWDPCKDAGLGGGCVYTFSLPPPTPLFGGVRGEVEGGSLIYCLNVLFYLQLINTFPP